MIGYDVATKLHEVIYDGKEEYCHFDLIQDLIMGDLKVLECSYPGVLTSLELLNVYCMHIS